MRNMTLRGCSLAVFFVAVGCAPQTGGGTGPTPDLSAVQRDLGTQCMNTGTNLLTNPSFEMAGAANNTGSPASTIPSWDGCCNMSAGTGTHWTTTQQTAHCGLASLAIQSTSATTNVLSQGLNMPGDAGMSFHLSGWVFLVQASPGSQILLDVFDLTANKVVASTVALTSTTSDWFQLSQTGTVPAGGNFQVRINDSGSISQAYVDDLSLTIP